MRYPLLICAILFSALSFSQTKLWSLAECIEYAHENNLTIQRSSLDLKSADLQRDAATANLFPNLNFNGGYFWQFGQSIDPITNTRRDGNRQTSSITLSSNWVLFDGLQNIKWMRQAKLDHLAAVYNLEAIKNDISLNIASAYLQVILNKQIYEVAENQLKISESQMNRSQKLYEAGSIAKGEFLQVQAQMARDDQSVIAAKNNVDISMLQLIQMLQLESYEGFDIVIPDLSDPDNVLLNYTPKQIYDVALGNQPSIKSSEVMVESAEKQLQISKGQFSPTISLQAQVNSNASQDLLRATGTGYATNPIGTVGNANPDPNALVYSLPYLTATGYENYPFFDQFGDNINQFVGINLQVPIFNRFQVRNNVRNSEIQLDRAMVDLELTKNDLRQTIERAYADAFASLKTFRASEKSLEATEENWKYAQKRYEQGAMNQFEYENTRNQFLNATAEMLQSKYDYIFKIKVLEFYLTNNITL